MDLVIDGNVAIIIWIFLEGPNLLRSGEFGMWKLPENINLTLSLTFTFCLSAMLGLVSSIATSNPAIARANDLDKVFTCKSVPAGVPTTSINVHLEKFSIPAEWSDGGSHYEIANYIFASVHPDKNSVKSICDVDANWGTREFRKYNAWTGNRWSYPLDFNLTIHNVPIDSVIKFHFSMREHDFSNSYDQIDLAEGQSVFAKMVMYPSKQMGFVLDQADKEQKDLKHTVVFGKSKRLSGLGEPFLGNDGTAIGTLDFIITASGSYAPNPNIGPKVGGGESSVSCKKYAQVAVSRNAEAKKLKCGFNPPEWSSDYNSHLTWCKRGGNAAQADDADARRVRAINDCKAKMNAASRDKSCRNYALTAVKHNQQAIKLNCGFRPPVWSNNHQGHFDWCMRGANSKSAANETNKRAQAIKVCKTSQAPKPAVPAPSAAQYCQNYAQDAINQYHVAQQRGCNFIGPEWSPDFTWHNNWCVKTYNAGNVAAIMAGTAKRNSMLATCN